MTIAARCWHRSAGPMGSVTTGRQAIRAPRAVAKSEPFAARRRLAKRGTMVTPATTRATADPGHPSARLMGNAMTAPMAIHATTMRSAASRFGAGPVRSVWTATKATPVPRTVTVGLGRRGALQTNCVTTERPATLATAMRSAASVGSATQHSSVRRAMRGTCVHSGASTAPHRLRSAAPTSSATTGRTQTLVSKASATSVSSVDPARCATAGMRATRVQARPIAGRWPRSATLRARAATGR